MNLDVEERTCERGADLVAEWSSTPSLLETDMMWTTTVLLLLLPYSLLSAVCKICTKCML